MSRRPAPGLLALTRLCTAVLLLTTFGKAAAQNADWMGQTIHSGTYLSDITIPGTHDSAARVDFTIGGIPYPDAASAQGLSITDQLNIGVRFLDLRFREDDSDDGLVPAHGPALQPGTAKGIFGEIASFLTDHPHEMIVISVKHEKDPLPGRSNISAAEFQRRVEALYLSDERFYLMLNLATSVPQYTYGSGLDAGELERVLDRVVLVRRYSIPMGNTGAPLGIDATDWPDDGGAMVLNDIHDVADTLRVEDHYEYDCYPADGACAASARSSKWGSVDIALTEALANEGEWVDTTTWDGRHRLRISFASATLMDPDVPLPSPGAITHFSNYVNPLLRDLAHRYRGRAGVVVVDRAYGNLVSDLVKMNSLRPFEAGLPGAARIDPRTRAVTYRMPSGADVALGGQAIGSPAVSGGANTAQMSVFVVGTDRSLYTSWQVSAGSSKFASWVYLGGELASNPAVVRLCTGVMQVFAKGTDDALWTTWQTSPGGHWSAWRSLGGVIHSRPLVTLSNCDATVSAIGDDGNTWAITRSSASASWGGWHRQ